MLEKVMSHFINQCSDEFAGKNGIITGGTAGIGLECAKELLKKGIDRLAILDLNVTLDTCRRLTGEYGKKRVSFVKCDVSKKTEVENAFKTIYDDFGRIDIVINNAGILDDLNWEKEIAVNLNGTINGTLIGLRYMSKLEDKSGGIVVNLSSLSGLVPASGCPVYSATSGAIINFTRSLSMPFNYTRTGVRMILLCPGATYTKIVSGASKKMLTEQMGKEWLRELTSTSTQKPENVASGLINILLNGENGSIWISDAGQPAYRVTLPTMNELKKR